MSTTATAADARRLPLGLIDAPANVRELDLAHVEALAGSIALRGLIVPLVVRPQGDGRYTLVAGFHRYAACRRAGLEQLPVVVREDDGEAADRAAENVVHKQLTPLEEAQAVKAMLEQGYTLDGAASVLGWARQRVSARRPQGAGVATVTGATGRLHGLRRGARRAPARTQGYPDSRRESRGRVSRAGWSTSGSFSRR